MMDHVEKEFFRYAVYDTVRSVPYGRATTYGAVARATGYPSLARLVGRVISDCEEPDVPAHRLVNAGGRLSERHLSEEGGRMRKELEKEGIKVVNGRIKDWKTVFWDPVEESCF